MLTDAQIDGILATFKDPNNLKHAPIHLLVAHIREQAETIESLKAAREKLDTLSDYVLQDWKHLYAKETLRRLAMEARAWVKDHPH